jgi:hypothetical protein
MDDRPALALPRWLLYASAAFWLGVIGIVVWVLV